MKVQELFEDATIPQLQQSIQRGFPDTKKRQHATNEVNTAAYQYLPVPRNDLLRVVSNTRSDNGNQYNQIIELRGVHYDVVQNDTHIPIKRGANTYYVRPVELNITNVGVSCTCPDYIMRFAHTNIANNCHIGPPPPNYVRKTTDRPPVNPMHVPGMCKHLLSVVDELEGRGLLL